PPRCVLHSFPTRRSSDLAAFNRAFFGTIHAFCVRLLESYGHYLGLPPTFDVITDDDEVWNEFVQQQTTIGRSLSDENRRELLRQDRKSTRLNSSHQIISY